MQTCVLRTLGVMGSRLIVVDKHPADPVAAVAAAIAQRRIQLGLSQSAAAAKASVAISTWQDFEDGNNRAHRADTESRIARALDWPSDALERVRSGDDDFAVESSLSDQLLDGLEGVEARLSELVDTMASMADSIAKLAKRLPVRS